MYSRNVKRKINPRETATFLNILFFGYTWSIFKLGLKRELIENDVFEVMNRFRSKKVTDKLEKHWKKQLKKSKPSILRALWCTFGVEYTYLIIFASTIRFVYMVINPIAISKIVGYFVEGQTSISREDAFYYAILLLLTKSFLNLLNHHFLLLLDQLSIKIKASLCSIVYRKTLQLDEYANNEVTAGHIMTIIAKDVEVIDEMVHHIHNVGIGLLEVGTICYITYNAVGVATFVGIGYLVALIPLALYAGIIVCRKRLEASKRSDERLRIMEEIFSTIKLIKMYSWDKYFTALGTDARKKEIEILRKLNVIKDLTVSLGSICGKLSIYLCMISYIYFNNNLSAEKAYLIVSCYENIKEILGYTIPDNINMTGEAISCLGRMNKLLLANEIPLRNNHEDDIINLSAASSIMLRAVDVKFSNEKQCILNNINIDFQNGLVGVTGSVGSGKSTLLKTILNDVLLSRGEVSTSGNMSYASQEPWIFPGTIRQNILFGEEFNEKRYNMVVRVCALEQDINNWSSGDNFLAIDRGLNISRGQQARINLARAIYRDADIYLLDDSLSALDSIVSEHIFNACVTSFLKDKLVILVTHNSKHLTKCTTVIYLNNGFITHRGSLVELEKLGVHFEDSLDNATLTKSEPKALVPSRNHFNSEMTNDINESTKLMQNAIDEMQIYQENRKKGKVDGSIYKMYFNFCGGWKCILPIGVVFMACELSYTIWDYYVSEWVDVEQNRTNYIERNLTNTKEFEDLQPNISFANTICNVILLAALILNVILMIGYYRMTAGASRKIHNISFNHIMSANMIFFDNNLSGTVMNRFSRDVNVIDERVPQSFFEIGCVIGASTGIVINIMLSNALFIIPTLIVGVIMYFVRNYYLKIGRCIYRLTSISKAPVVGHLNASLNGLTTIRASGKQQILMNQFDRHQDLFISAYFMHATTFRTFLHYMNGLCNVYISIVVFTFLLISTDAMAGKVGLGITQSFALTGILQWAIFQTTNLEVYMTSCERILEYTALKSESSSGKLITKWPGVGKLEFSNVNMCYSNSNKPVLKNISFVVNPKEKFGIIGRSGAGKSSIISALFRLYEISGQIKVDDVDISELELTELRSRISIIPQDPVLYAGSLRANLDPYQQYTDEYIWQALKEVELNSIDSLYCIVQHGGRNFSFGQRQLICLARAILKNNKIVVLDEATASVDPHTNILMQNIIERVFADCTMLIIAHRLSTVMTCDKVMVVDNGIISEFGSTKELLENTEGIFYNLISASTE